MREDGCMPNRLADATSPYLLQHAESPVDWRPWGVEAFGEARRRGVPVRLPDPAQMPRSEEVHANLIDRQSTARQDLVLAEAGSEAPVVGRGGRGEVRMACVEAFGHSVEAGSRADGLSPGSD
ncbi:hypothetical protein P3T27_002005 [Kitasatospora sp. MAA19]|nr:hypothetical protein [Kitasatospora sp. MAA19]